MTYVLKDFIVKEKKVPFCIISIICTISLLQSKVATPEIETIIVNFCYVPTLSIKLLSIDGSWFRH